jgi:hypothetical protein
MPAYEPQEEWWHTVEGVDYPPHNTEYEAHLSRQPGCMVRKETPFTTYESINRILLNLGDKFFYSDGRQVSVRKLVGRTLVLYFGRNPMTNGHAREKRLLKQLQALYPVMRKKLELFEVIYISTDRTESSFEDAFSRMPWLAIPYAEVGPFNERRNLLKKMFDITVSGLCLSKMLVHKTNLPILCSQHRH